MAGKLHELIAVEPNVQAAHNAIAEETLKVLGKAEHFQRHIETVSYFDDSDSKLNTSQTKDNTTSVDERLNYSFGRVFANYIDTIGSRDRTNQEARADIIVNGQILARDLPTTLLLTLETKLERKRAELEAVPTLASGPVWQWDANEQMWRTAEPVVSFRTQKTVRPIVLSPATDKHPAQVHTITEDKPVAKITRTTFAAMWTSRQKHNAIARLDALLAAVKKARQRANRTDIIDIKVGAKLADFILRGPDSESLSDVDNAAA